MGVRFWIRRTVLVFLCTYLVICLAQFLKGHTVNYAATQGILWGAITTAIFISARLFQSRRGQHCEICNDTPEMQSHSRESAH